MSKYDNLIALLKVKLFSATSACIACSVTEAIIFVACLNRTSESSLDPFSRKKAKVYRSLHVIIRQT